jgi:hypothetical protein
VTFCEIFPPDNLPLYFYWYPKAPDLEIRPTELDLDAIRAARVFWVTVTGLSQEPSRSATLAALEARAKAGITILDLDYRPMFWPSREARPLMCADSVPCFRPLTRLMSDVRVWVPALVCGGSAIMHLRTRTWRLVAIVVVAVLELSLLGPWGQVGPRTGRCFRWSPIPAEHPSPPGGLGLGRQLGNLPRTPNTPISPIANPVCGLCGDELCEVQWWQS